MEEKEKQQRPDEILNSADEGKKGGMVGQVSSRKKKQKRIQGSRTMTHQLVVVVMVVWLLLSLSLMLMLANVSIGGKTT